VTEGRKRGGNIRQHNPEMTELTLTKRITDFSTDKSAANHENMEPIKIQFVEE
jgi:hypothetical protein